MILDILFPNRCLECEVIISHNELVCDCCFLKINFTHWDFGDNPLKRKAEFLFPLQNAFALMNFEENGLSRKIIHQLKYGSQEKIGRILAEWTIEHLDFKTQKPDLILPVPLHPKKMKERGYNQLYLFSEILSDYYQIPFRKDLLKRNTYENPQASKDKSDRNSMKYNFSLTEHIENQHILLIDDVFTTGNTMSAIVWEILKNTNNQLSILVMAMER